MGAGWSESLLGVLWVAGYQVLLHAENEEPAQTERMPRLVLVFIRAQIICCFCRVPTVGVRRLTREVTNLMFIDEIMLVFK